MNGAQEKGLGLTELRTDELKSLLKLIYNGKLACPFNRQSLMTMGFNRVSECAEILCNLEERSVRAILFSVLAERKIMTERLAKLAP